MEVKITNCVMCSNHVVEPDPDPTDWFDDDDVKVRCRLSTKTQASGRAVTEEPYITVGCRPYMIEKECSIPSWCPLIKKES